MIVSPIINGAFDTWTHRDFHDIGDALPATATGGYWSDRFGHRGAGSYISPRRMQFAPGERPGNPRYFHRTVVTSIAGASHAALVANDVHRSDTFAGVQSTLFFDARADQARNIAIEWQRDYGTGVASAAEVLIALATKIAITAEWATYKLLVTLPSVAGKIIGPNDDDYVTPVWFYDAGSGWNERTQALGQQSGVFDLARVGWLAGDLTAHPDPFSLLDTAHDPVRCLAYARMGEGHEALKSAAPVEAGRAYWSSVSFGAPMRAKPKVTLVSKGQSGFGSASGTVDATRFGFNECRVATATGSCGWFWSRWLADAEFPYTP